MEATRELVVAGSTPETTLGRVTALAARRDGGVLVFDAAGSSGPAFRAYDASGHYERTYGRKGEGPGEYSTSRIALAEAPDGTVWLRDGGRVVNRYHRDGRLIGSTVLAGDPKRNLLFPGANGAFSTSAGVVVDEAYLRRVGSRGPVPAEFDFMVSYDSTGAVQDSIRPRSWLAFQARGASQDEPRQMWTPLSDGRAALMRTDIIGVLIVDLRDSNSRPILGEIPSEPVSLPAEYVAERQAARDIARRRSPGLPLTVPNVEHPARSLVADVDDRIWVTRVLAPVKGSRHCVEFVLIGSSDEQQCVAWVSYSGAGRAYAIFNSGGQLLGEVSFPKSVVTAPVAQGDFAWAVIEEDSGEQLLAKFRLKRKS